MYFIDMRKKLWIWQQTQSGGLWLIPSKSIETFGLTILFLHKNKILAFMNSPYTYGCVQNGVFFGIFKKIVSPELSQNIDNFFTKLSNYWIGTIGLRQTQIVQKWGKGTQALVLKGPWTLPWRANYNSYPFNMKKAVSCKYQSALSW